MEKETFYVHEWQEQEGKGRHYYYNREDLIILINDITNDWKDRHDEDWFDVLKNFINSVRFTNPSLGSKDPSQ